MNDPLKHFDWKILHKYYDAQCVRFSKDSDSLVCFKTNRPETDRELYYRLSECFSKRQLINIKAYEALLYWKLYSQPAACSNIARWFGDSGKKERAAENLKQLLKEMPISLNKNESEVLRLVEQIGSFPILGMASAAALPVRTTFLHYLYPSVVPIFDKMVLKATGMWSENANHRITVLRDYLPCAWQLADRYKTHTSFLTKESSIRCIDMALWVSRGYC